MSHAAFTNLEVWYSRARCLQEVGSALAIPPACSVSVPPAVNDELENYLKISVGDDAFPRSLANPPLIEIVNNEYQSVGQKFSIFRECELVIQLRMGSIVEEHVEFIATGLFFT